MAIKQDILIGLKNPIYNKINLQVRYIIGLIEDKNFLHYFKRKKKHCRPEMLGKKHLKAARSCYRKLYSND